MDTLYVNKSGLLQVISVENFAVESKKATCIELPEERISFSELMSSWHEGSPGWAFAPPI